MYPNGRDEPIKSEMRSENEMIKDNSADFNYFAFHRHLQLKSEVERTLRLQLLISRTPLSELPNLEAISDDDIAGEFMGKHGPLDLNSEDGKKLFNTYKVGKLEELARWHEKERGPLASMDDIDVQWSVEVECVKAFQNYKPSRNSNYNQNPYTNIHNAEWFILPRNTYSLKDNLQLLEKKKRKKLINDVKEVGGLIIERIDLRIFDPKFESGIVIHNVSNPANDIVKRKLTAILNKFCLGITPEEISAEWLEANKYNLDVHQSDCYTFSEYVSKMPDLFWRHLTGKYSDVVFPAYLEGFTLPLSVYKRISQRIIFLMYCNGGQVMEDQFANLMRNMFQIEVGSYSTMLKNFLEDYYYVYSPFEESLFYNWVEPNYVLTFEKPEVNVVEYKLPTSSKIPDKYVQINEKCNWMSNVVPRLSNMLFVPAYIKNFQCFYLLSMETLDILKAMMTELGRAYPELYHGMRDPSIPNPECLVVGLLVAVKFRASYINNYVCYYRAKIIDVLSVTNGTKYKVALIDVGEIVEVSIDDIRYLEKSFLPLAAQAIECTSRCIELKLYQLYYNGFLQWDEMEIKCFKKEIRNQMIHVRFFNRTIRRPENGYGLKWLVNINRVNQKMPTEITSNDVDIQAIATIQEKFIKFNPRTRGTNTAIHKVD